MRGNDGILHRRQLLKVYARNQACVGIDGAVKRRHVVDMFYANRSHVKMSLRYAGRNLSAFGGAPCRGIVAAFSSGIRPRLGPWRRLRKLLAKRASCSCVLPARAALVRHLDDARPRRNIWYLYLPAFGARPRRAGMRLARHPEIKEISGG